MDPPATCGAGAALLRIAIQVAARPRGQPAANLAISDPAGSAGGSKGLGDERLRQASTGALTLSPMEFERAFGAPALTSITRWLHHVAEMGKARHDDGTGSGQWRADLTGAGVSLLGAEAKDMTSHGGCPHQLAATDLRQAVAAAERERRGHGRGSTVAVKYEPALAAPATQGGDGGFVDDRGARAPRSCACCSAVRPRTHVLAGADCRGRRRPTIAPSLMQGARLMKRSAAPSPLQARSGQTVPACCQAMRRRK